MSKLLPGVLCLVISAATPLVAAENIDPFNAIPPESIKELSLEDRVDELLYHMSNAEKAAQLIMVYFAGEAFVSEHQFGGVLVMQNMLKDQTKITNELAALQSNSKAGVFVAIDQEGGIVNRIKRLPGWNKTPSAKVMREWDTAKITELTNRIGIQLNEIGINMNLAPVLDPSLDYKGPVSYTHLTLPTICSV